MSGTAVKPRWQKVDGVLLLDKSLGLSSNTALQKVRRLYAAAKAGHTGTLDPLATGLLPVCFGEATKFSADLLEADKRYIATVQLGQRTTTGDREGAVIEERPVNIENAQLLNVLSQFRGAISQCPPMYSALKQDGKTLYQLARQGIEVERPLRHVQIYLLELVEFSGTSCVLDVRCSKGTYIRTLAEDIGEALACGAHLSALRRTEVGALTLTQASSLEVLEAMDEQARAQYLLPVDTLLSSLPKIILDMALAQRFSHGNPVLAVAPQQRCRVYRQDDTGERLLGIGDGDEEGLIHPRRLLAE